MPRPPRIHEPGSLHHLTAHGVDARPLFADDADRWRFLGLLGELTRKTDLRCLAFCLMDTHYHLLVQERDVPLARAMHLLNSRYASDFNRRHGRRGHLFDGRYRDRLIADHSHLLSTIRYLALNPVEVGARTRPEDCPWSSYGQLVGTTRPLSFVSRAWTLSLFAPERTRAIERVRQFVESVPGTVPVPGTSPATSERSPS